MANKRRRETCMGLRSADIETRQGSGPVAEDVAALTPRAVTLSSGGCSVQRVGLLFSSVANRRHGFESDSNAESRRWLSFCAAQPRSYHNSKIARTRVMSPSSALLDRPACLCLFLGGA